MPFRVRVACSNSRTAPSGLRFPSRGRKLIVPPTFRHFPCSCAAGTQLHLRLILVASVINILEVANYAAPVLSLAARRSTLPDDPENASQARVSRSRAGEFRRWRVAVKIYCSRSFPARARTAPHSHPTRVPSPQHTMQRHQYAPLFDVSRPTSVAFQHKVEQRFTLQLAAIHNSEVRLSQPACKVQRRVSGIHRPGAPPRAIRSHPASDPHPASR